MEELPSWSPAWGLLLAPGYHRQIQGPGAGHGVRRLEEVYSNASQFSDSSDSLSTGVCLTLKGAQPHFHLSLFWGTFHTYSRRTQPNGKYPAGKPQKSKLSREEIDSHNPSLPLWLSEYKQRAVVFSPQEKLYVQNRKQAMQEALLE